jgi:hypothetical protein
MQVSKVLGQQQGASSMELDHIDRQDENNDYDVDISLRLGRSEQKISKKEENKVDKISTKNVEESKDKRSALGFGFQIQSYEASKLDDLCRQVKLANAENKCVSSRKDVKSVRNENHQDVLEEHEQTGLKKTRVCVKASCEDPSVRTIKTIHYIYVFIYHFTSNLII